MDVEKNSLGNLKNEDSEQKGGAFFASVPRSVAKAPSPKFHQKKGGKQPALLRSVIRRYNRDRMMAELQRFARQSPERVRQFKYDGLISCLNVIEALLHHVNLKSWLVFLSLTVWAEEAGLATRSKSGRMSITRAFRALVWLGRFGIVNIKRTRYDKQAGIRLPVFVQVTKTFWQLCGAAPDRMIEERKRLCLESGIQPEDEEILALARQQWREYCEIATADNSLKAKMKAAAILERRNGEREAKKQAKEEARARRTPSKAPDMAFYLAGIPSRLHAGITCLSHAMAIYQLYNKPGKPPTR